MQLRKIHILYDTNLPSSTFLIHVKYNIDDF